MEDDFDDEETFGLGPEGKSQRGPHREAEQQEDEEEDIYGDIAGQPAGALVEEPVSEATPIGGASGLQEKVAQKAERQSSGQLAESRSTSVPKGTNAKAPLPKRLADTTVVYVGELQWWTTDADIERICVEFGPVESLTFFEDKGTGKSKGYALVKFANKEAANLCRQQMNGKEINGRKCVVTFSSNSSAAAAAAKAGGWPEGRQSAANGSATGPGRGQHYSSQSSGAPGRGRGYGRMGPWAAEPAMPMPPMMPWTGMPMMGVGMGGLPMPGGAGMSFMGMMDSRNQGHGAERDYKRRRN